MKKKFAFLLMGAHYDPACHQADFETENRLTSIRTVQDYYLSEEDRMEVDYYPREDKLLLFKPRSEDGYTFMLEK